MKRRAPVHSKKWLICFYQFFLTHKVTLESMKFNSQYYSFTLIAVRKNLRRLLVHKNHTILFRQNLKTFARFYLLGLKTRIESLRKLFPVNSIDFQIFFSVIHYRSNDKCKICCEHVKLSWQEKKISNNLLPQCSILYRCFYVCYLLKFLFFKN